jgi:hypothetical protein
LGVTQGRERDCLSRSDIVNFAPVLDSGFPVSDLAIVFMVINRACLADSKITSEREADGEAVDHVQIGRVTMLGNPGLPSSTSPYIGSVHYHRYFSTKHIKPARNQANIADEQRLHHFDHFFKL